MKSEEIVKLPLNSILSAMGWKVDLTKSTKRSIVMDSENGEKVIINRLQNGDYLYFNPHNDSDRGNFFSFCKKRGIDSKELLKKYESFKVNGGEEHILIKQDSVEIGENRKKRIAEFKDFETLSPEEENTVLKRRMIENIGFKNLKKDEKGNLCVPLYGVVTQEDNKYLKQDIITLCGYSAKLKNPLIQDREGNKLEKPIKSLIYGGNGAEVILTKNFNMNAKTIIISESIFDSLACREIFKFSPDESIFVGTGGTIAKDGIKVIESLAQKYDQADFILAFDNDSKGKKYTEDISILLSECIEQSKIKRFVPSLKDFNDDLKAMKMLGKDTNIDLEKSVLEKIKRCDEKIKTSFLSEPEKEKMSKRVIELKKLVFEKNKEKEKSEKLSHYRTR